MEDVVYGSMQCTWCPPNCRHHMHDDKSIDSGILGPAGTLQWFTVAIVYVCNHVNACACACERLYNGCAMHCHAAAAAAGARHHHIRPQT